MKELTKKQVELANVAVDALRKLQSQGVVTLIIDGGGGTSGLTFWRPTQEEDFEAYEIISYPDHPKHDEFEEKKYWPDKSIGLRIDNIVP